MFYRGRISNQKHSRGDEGAKGFPKAFSDPSRTIFSSYDSYFRRSYELKFVLAEL